MKELSPKNIARIKNTTNEETGRAYLDLEEREFILHFPNRFKKRILDTKTDEILVLYQTIENKRYLTHLIRPIDNNIIEENARENFKFGRICEVIAYPGEDNKISPLPPLPLLVFSPTTTLPSEVHTGSRLILPLEPLRYIS
jgi:hypothetical protein